MAVPTKSFLFDGVDESVDFGTNDPTIDFALGDFTYAFWFKSEATKLTTQGLLGHATTAPLVAPWILIEITKSDQGVGLNNKLAFDIRGDTGGSFNIRSDAEVAGDNTWYHAILRRTSGTLSMLIDAVVQAATVDASTADLSSQATSILVAGAQPYTGVNDLQGNMLHLVVYDFALSDLQATELYECGLSKKPQNLSFADPIFFAPLDEATVFDHAYEVIGGDAVDLDGVDENITLGQRDDLAPGTGAMEISGDFSIDVSDSFFRYIYFYGRTGGVQIGVVKNNTNLLRFFIWDSSGTVFDVVSNSAIAGDSVKHTFRAVLASGGAMTLYLDDVLQTDTATNTYDVVTNSGNRAVIGARHDSSDAYLDFHSGRIGAITIKIGVTNISSYALGFGDIIPVATDSLAAGNGTYTNMEAVDLGTFFGGAMQNMESGDIELDVPVDPGCPVAAAADELPSRFIKRYRTMFRADRV